MRKGSARYDQQPGPAALAQNLDQIHAADARQHEVDDVEVVAVRLGIAQSASVLGSMFSSQSHSRKMGPRWGTAARPLALLLWMFGEVHRLEARK